MKEKMLVRLEKERLQARTEALEAQVLPPPTPTFHLALPLTHIVYQEEHLCFHLEINKEM